MSKVDRRHFLMSSMALPAVLNDASAAAECEQPVGSAVVGFNGRGKAHISAYLKMPNVEIAALCDVDEAVMDRGCKMVQAASEEASRDLRRHPQDARRQEHRRGLARDAELPPHAADDLGRAGGKDVLVEKPSLQHVRGAADHRGRRASTTGSCRTAPGPARGSTRRRGG